jgi:predicted deacetylase
MPSDEGIQTLVSVHDVMPATLDAVETILTELEAAGIAPVTLLVIPGADWQTDTIDRLRALQARGYELAGHGWRHHVDRITGLAHRVHAGLISRNVAEHLAQDADGIQDLIARCHDWFLTHDLGAPRLYCPPAWAMGDIPRNRLTALPFKEYELFAGVLCASTGRLKPIPLLGYEADTPTRAPVIRVWNRLNRWLAVHMGWVRIGIHPFDLRLRLAADLRRDLRIYRRAVGYAAAAE